MNRVLLQINYLIIIRNKGLKNKNKIIEVFNKCQKDKETCSILAYISIEYYTFAQLLNFLKYNVTFTIRNNIHLI